MGEQEFVSILNDVLGPVMRGPSSSHTAGSYHIGRLARSLLGEEPKAGTFTFDPDGSYAQTFREQGADLGFASGLMNWPITDERFPQALEIAKKDGLRLSFRVKPLEHADHPNTVRILLEGRGGARLNIIAKSTGGGGVVISLIEGLPVALTGKAYDVVVLARKAVLSSILKVAGDSKRTAVETSGGGEAGLTLIDVRRTKPIEGEDLRRLRELPGVRKVWTCDPVFYVKKGESAFASGAAMADFAKKRKLSLGRAALVYESQLLGLSEAEVLAEMGRRFDIMQSAVDLGLKEKDVRMRLLEPCAKKVFASEAKGTMAIGGINTRAAARAMAALHISNSGGVICAAPTGASAGVIPGVIVTLAEEKGLNREQISQALLAAGAVGLIVARRATFAAEVAGCQVEIGAAGAMAAAMVVDWAGGSAEDATNAAAIAFQNTMGSVCDLVQGLCEIPCHTRNGVAASNAFVCADLILGGYRNPIPLDETIDAVFASGKMLPRELRCTVQGGIALAPSARALRAKK